MPFTLTMPKLTPTMEEGVIAKWHKKVGDFIESGELIMEVATDKATVEHNAIDEGWLRKILVQEGSEAKVNQPIAILSEEQSENIDSYQVPGGVIAEPQVPKKEETPIVQPKTKAAEPAKTSPVKMPVPPISELPKKQIETTSDATQGRILASPLAKKLAKERSLDLSSVHGTGPGNRIMSCDLEHAQPLTRTSTGIRQHPKHPVGAFVEETMSPMRKAISKRLQESKSTIPHFYVQKTIDARALVNLKEQLHAHELKVSINDCIIKACALALREHPGVNSGFNATNNTLIRFQTIDISVAVSVEGGLITPIIRYADFKSLFEISKEVKELAKKAKEGKLDPIEYQGGSFTVSNLGMYDVADFQAIINPPQGAILSVSSVLDVPVVKNCVVVPGKVMNMTISSDHRVIDGVASAEFFKTLKKHLENPVTLLL
jgi:pyruvate dehydrogenase E2 component (dihydrolipoamide acetyltransferase)